LGYDCSQRAVDGQATQVQGSVVDQSPPSISIEKRTNTYNVNAFRLELAGRFAMWIKHGLLPSKMLTVSDVPTGRALQYCLQLKGIGGHYGDFMGTL
jgi:hypothetical protein